MQYSGLVSEPRDGAQHTQQENIPKSTFPKFTFSRI